MPGMMKRAALLMLFAAAACVSPGEPALSQLPDVDTNALMRDRGFPVA